jgi:hypothetical protein
MIDFSARLLVAPQESSICRDGCYAVRTSPVSGSRTGPTAAMTKPRIAKVRASTAMVSEMSCFCSLSQVMQAMKKKRSGSHNRDYPTRSKVAHTS